MLNRQQSLRRGDEFKPIYHVSVSVGVSDSLELWTAALMKGLESRHLGLAEVVELIGSADDPSIESCIGMLAAPTALPGCTLEQYRIGPTTSAVTRLAPADRCQSRDSGSGIQPPPAKTPLRTSTIWE